MDAVARSSVAAARDQVVVRVAIIAAIPPEIVVSRDVDRRDARQPVADPVERLRQRRMDVAGDDGDIEPAGWRVRRRVPGVIRPVLVQIGKDPEPRHGGLLETVQTAVEADAKDREGGGFGRFAEAGLEPYAFRHAHALAEGAKPTGAFEENGAVVCHPIRLPNTEQNSNAYLHAASRKPGWAASANESKERVVAHREVQPPRQCRRRPTSEGGREAVGDFVEAGHSSGGGYHNTLKSLGENPPPTGAPITEKAPGAQDYQCRPTRNRQIEQPTPITAMKTARCAATEEAHLALCRCMKHGQIIGTFAIPTL